jgi:hypothetical protein
MTVLILFSIGICLLVASAILVPLSRRTSEHVESKRVLRYIAGMFCLGFGIILTASSFTYLACQMYVN